MRSVGSKLAADDEKHLLSAIWFRVRANLPITFNAYFIRHSKFLSHFLRKKWVIRSTGRSVGRPKTILQHQPKPSLLKPEDEDGTQSTQNTFISSK